MTTRNRDDSTSSGEPPPGSIADTYRLVMPLIDFEAALTKGGDVALTVPPAQLHNVLQRGRDDARLRMNLLRNLTAVDWVERGLELVYHLYSIEHRHAAAIKAWLPSEGGAVATATDLYATADWAERECREMFGIEFIGHPDPRNLLLDEDLDIHPLRKSHPLAPIEIEQGVDVEYFTKQFPPEQPVSPQEKEAEAAAAERPARRPDAELSEEERAAKRAAQAERVARARELAAARRAERAAGAPPAGGARPADSAAPSPAAPPPAAAPAPAPAAPAAAVAAPPAAERPPAAPPPDLPAIPDAEEDPEGRAAAQAERVRIGRELSAARRAQLRGQ